MSKLDEIRWEIYKYKSKKLLLWGLRNHYIFPYTDELLEKLRTIYYGGLPASIILLSNSLSNGHCYDRALLLSQAFIDTDDDVNLIYADVDSIRLNPLYKEQYQKEDPTYSDHCFVERITKNDVHIIYDTSSGFIYGKEIYWKMEHPKIRKINDKNSIIEFVKSEQYYHPQNMESDKYVLPLIIPMIESTYGMKTEGYSLPGLEMLQKEVNYFKEAINYDNICKEIDDDMKRLRMRK